MESIQYEEIYEKDIKNYKWRPIQDYNELFFISKEDIYPDDIEIYIDLVIRKIAREFKVDYNYAREIVREENEPFFLAKSRFFEDEEYYSMKIENERVALKNLFNLFYIPIKNLDNTANVDKLIELFNSLTHAERLEFLTRMEKVAIKVDKIK